MIVTFAIFLLAISISQIVSYKLLQIEYYSKLEELGIVLFVTFFLINIIFTYNKRLAMQKIYTAYYMKKKAKKYSTYIRTL